MASDQRQPQVLLLLPLVDLVNPRKHQQHQVLGVLDRLPPSHQQLQVLEVLGRRPNHQLLPVLEVLVKQRKQHQPQVLEALVRLHRQQLLPALEVLGRQPRQPLLQHLVASDSLKLPLRLLPSGASDLEDRASELQLQQLPWPRHWEASELQPPLLHLLSEPPIPVHLADLVAGLTCVSLSSSRGGRRRCTSR